MTAAESAHMGRVAALGCVVCKKLMLGNTPASVHHVRAGTGWGRASDFEVIPLCPHHHQGDEGLHTLGTKAWARKYWSEAELLEAVLAELNLRLVMDHKGRVSGTAEIPR